MKQATELSFISVFRPISMDNSSTNNQIKITFADIGLTRQLFGEHNVNLQKIAGALGIEIHARGNTVIVFGDSIQAA
ncbi:MAG: hypothetical protein JRE58_00610, partial [Deltaproteobacteria bacterium]|nr:hypothetical protein [Deltaproteobacteria bacterium]